MTITVTLQVASDRLAPNELEAAIGYKASKLTVKGADRTPPRAVPKQNLWNLGFEADDSMDLDSITKAILDQCPDLPERLNALAVRDPGINCVLYFGLRPFSRDFVLFLEGESVARLGALQCALSIEYFGE